MNIEMLFPIELFDDEESIKLFNEFMIDLQFTATRLKPEDTGLQERILSTLARGENPIFLTPEDLGLQEPISSLSDNDRILKEWYKKLLKADVSDSMKGLKEACTKVTERLLGCFGALCHALKMLNGPNIEKYCTDMGEILEDFNQEIEEATKDIMLDFYKIEV